MSLGLIAILVTVLWLGSMGAYIYVSRQQRDLQSAIESLQKTLGEPNPAQE